jgi:hypothetical protein
MHQSSKPSLALVLAVPLLIALAPASAAADAKTCVASHASAQREVKAGRLKQAAQLFTACGSDNTCPEQLRAECSELLDKVKTTVPSVIFSAVDGKGADVSNVKVYIDDALLVDGLDGRAVELDPGKYHFRFVLPDNSELSVDALVREGEKNRLIGVRAAEEKQAPLGAPAALAQPVAVEAPPKPLEKKTPVAAWVATGVAVVGFGTFGTFAILGSSDKKKLDDCAPNCPESEQSRHDSLKTKYLIADIGLGVGAVSAIVAGVLFLTAGPSEAERRAKEGNRGLSFNATTNGGQLILRGQF